MQFQMMALIGEFERGTIAQNVKMGMNAKAKAGEWCGGIVLGYDLKTIPEEGNKESEQNSSLMRRKHRLSKESSKALFKGMAINPSQTS